ncbi:hypothetical protein HII31_13079 [Pseudocercospora fuligena]|uniref:Uncharacterized protein n=1 Tax=Pseudocercospora fuligena TaxID=685502 RepID=A0A8H6R836_9PEZI|nr:hypothetical protein HII31_13079 [Pseudocercospora fuligena]
MNHCMALCFTHFDEHFQRFIHTFSNDKDFWNLSKARRNFVFPSASYQRRACYSKIPYIRFCVFV